MILDPIPEYGLIQWSYYLFSPNNFVPCTDKCELDLSMCIYCGDGVINGTEKCDVALIQPTCDELGLPGGKNSTSCTAVLDLLKTQYHCVQDLSPCKD